MYAMKNQTLTSHVSAQRAFVVILAKLCGQFNNCMIMLNLNYKPMQS